MPSLTWRYLVRRLPDTHGLFGRARAEYEVAFVPEGAARAAWVRRTRTPDAVLVHEGWHPTDAYDALASAKEAWDGSLGRWANVYAAGDVRVPGLLPASELPDDWTYPEAFLELVEGGSLGPAPWDLLLDGPLYDRFVELRSSGDGVLLVPFATRDGGRRTACWVAGTGSPAPVVVVSAPGAVEERFASYDDWSAAQT